MGERRLSAILAGGNHLTATGTFAATNPLRYRGYCYDTETGLYYLQSRYYDPTTARFLNADTFASTCQGLLGNNMFAYCLNNPVNLEDITGSAARACFDDNDRLKENPWKDPISGGGAQSEVPSPSKSHKVLNNVEEHMTLHALKKQGYAFYNGVPVVKMPIDNRAFSLGFMIVVGENVNDPETLKHEWGHSLHFRHIGQTKYIKYTLIPSMIGYWSGVDWLLYYSQPWEYMAELFGKVNRPGYPYIDNAETIARIYFWATFFAPA